MSGLTPLGPRSTGTTPADAHASGRPGLSPARTATTASGDGVSPSTTSTSTLTIVSNGIGNATTTGRSGPALIRTPRAPATGAGPNSGFGPPSINSRSSDRAGSERR